jgi:hypothetical protein
MFSGHGKGIDWSFGVLDSKLQQGHGSGYNQGKIMRFTHG